VFGSKSELRTVGFRYFPVTRRFSLPFHVFTRSLYVESKLLFKVKLLTCWQLLTVKSGFVSLAEVIHTGSVREIYGSIYGFFIISFLLSSFFPRLISAVGDWTPQNAEVQKKDLTQVCA